MNIYLFYHRGTDGTVRTESGTGSFHHGEHGEHGEDERRIFLREEIQGNGRGDGDAAESFVCEAFGLGCSSW